MLKRRRIEQKVSPRLPLLVCKPKYDRYRYLRKRKEFYRDVTIRNFSAPICPAPFPEPFPVTSVLFCNALKRQHMRAPEKNIAARHARRLDQSSCRARI